MPVLSQAWSLISSLRITSSKQPHHGLPCCSPSSGKAIKSCSFKTASERAVRELLRPHHPSPPDTPGCHLLLWLSFLWNKTSQSSEFPAGKWLPLGNTKTFLFKCMCDCCSISAFGSIYAHNALERWTSAAELFLMMGNSAPLKPKTALPTGINKTPGGGDLKPSLTLSYVLNSSSPELFTRFKVL